MTTAPRQLDAIVIGGSIAGLTCAYVLGQFGYRTVLLERSPFLGGMDRSFEISGGRRFDCGLHVLDENRSELVTKLFRHVVDDEVFRIPRKRGIVLRNHMIGYNTPAAEWPDELREMLPQGDIVDRIGADAPTRENIARYYGAAFADLIYDEVLPSYLSETRHLAFGVDPAELLVNIYPWFFPRASRGAIVDDPSRQYQDKVRAMPEEYFLYPREGGFGGFAAGFHRKLQAVGVDVRTGVDDLAFDIDAQTQSARSVTANGELLWAPRIYWNAPAAVLDRVLGLGLAEAKPDQFLLGSLEFEKPLHAPFSELILGDPNLLIKRASFPGHIDEKDADLVQLEFCFPRAGEGFALEPEYWSERWTADLRRLGVAGADNALKNFDLKTFPILYNCYGVEGRKMPEIDVRLDPRSNLRPVLLSIRNININTRVPQFLHYLLEDLTQRPAGKRP